MGLEEEREKMLEREAEAAISSKNLERGERECLSPQIIR